MRLRVQRPQSQESDYSAPLLLENTKLSVDHFEDFLRVVCSIILQSNPVITTSV